MAPDLKREFEDRLRKELADPTKFVLILEDTEAHREYRSRISEDEMRQIFRKVLTQ